MPAVTEATQDGVFKLRRDLLAEKARKRLVLEFLALAAAVGVFFFDSSGIAPSWAKGVLLAIVAIVVLGDTVLTPRAIPLIGKTHMQLRDSDLLYVIGDSEQSFPYGSLAIEQPTEARPGITRLKVRSGEGTKYELANFERMDILYGELQARIRQSRSGAALHQR